MSNYYETFSTDFLSALSTDYLNSLSSFKDEYPSYVNLAHVNLPFNSNTTSYELTSNFDNMSIKKNLTVGGVNILNTLQEIKDRLLLLDDHSSIRDKFPTLARAYDQYKMVEQLCITSNKK